MCTPFLACTCEILYCSNDKEAMFAHHMCFAVAELEEAQKLPIWLGGEVRGIRLFIPCRGI